MGRSSQGAPVAGLAPSSFLDLYIYSTVPSPQPPLPSRSPPQPYLPLCYSDSSHSAQTAARISNRAQAGCWRPPLFPLAAIRLSALPTILIGWTDSHRHRLQHWTWAGGGTSFLPSELLSADSRRPHSPQGPEGQGRAREKCPDAATPRCDRSVAAGPVEHCVNGCVHRPVENRADPGRRGRRKCGHQLGRLGLV